jgi:ferredoxin
MAKKKKTKKRERKEYFKAYFQERRNDPEKAESDRARRRRRIKEKREWIQKHKEIVGCEACGSKHPFYVLEFHHRNSEAKDNEISNMISTDYSRDAIVREVKKCMVVCRNCHAEIHWRESNGNESG